MQAFLQSAFLQALSYSLIASIWQMALLWLAVVILFKLFKLSSAQKFNIAFIAQMSGLILFIYTGFHVYSTAGTEKIFNITSADNFLLSINTFLIAGMPYAAAIYLCVLMFKFWKLVFIYNGTKELRTHDLKKIAAANRIFVQEMCELFSLKRKVKIYLSGKITCPLTAGFLKPVILIPVAAINHLTTEQMEAVILHELAHIKRFDYLLFIIQNLADKVFFFNVFSGMLSNIIELERENACDDWVLQFRYNSMHYAEALFKLGRLKAMPALVMSFSGKKESLLLIRIKRLLHNPQPKNSYSLQSVLAGFLSVIIMAGLIISVSKPVEQKAANNKFASAENYKTLPVSFKEKMPGIKIASAKKEKKNLVKTESDKATLNDTNKENAKQSELNAEAADLALKQSYLIQVKQSLDSLKNIMPEYRSALNSQVVITPDVLRNAISYQNFKQIESMLAASGESINVTETESSKNSYQKEITIEAKDKNGNTHIYTVIVQLYQ